MFAGCHDLLKVYGWEPFRSYDTVAMGWGKIADIAVAKTQLVGGRRMRTVWAVRSDCVVCACVCVCVCVCVCMFNHRPMYRDI